jgi:hypothetical protein
MGPNGQKIGTSTTVTSSDNTTTYGGSVTFTATVSPGAAAGSVEFFVDGTSIEARTILGGMATLTTSNISAGSHTIKAKYNGSASYAVSEGTCSQAVAKANAVIRVSGSTVIIIGKIPLTVTAHDKTVTSSMRPRHIRHNTAALWPETMRPTLAAR